MDITKLLSDLNLTPNDSVVIGSGILNALGLRPSNDIDVVVNEEAFARFKQDPRFVEGQNHGQSILAYDLFEIFTAWVVLGKDQTFEELYKESTVINGVRYITPQFLLATKKSWLADDGRPKDFADVKLIEDYLSKKALENHE